MLSFRHQTVIEQACANSKSAEEFARDFAFAAEGVVEPDEITGESTLAEALTVALKANAGRMLETR